MPDEELTIAVAEAVGDEGYSKHVRHRQATDSTPTVFSGSYVTPRPLAETVPMLEEKLQPFAAQYGASWHAVTNAWCAYWKFFVKEVDIDKPETWTSAYIDIEADGKSRLVACAKSGLKADKYLKGMKHG